MLFNDLFEDEREPYQKAIDKLEVSHINALNAKMDGLSARARVAHGDGDHDLYNALKREWTKCKAERDSIYGIKEGTPQFQVECDEQGNASVIDRIGQAIAHFTAQKYGSTAFDAASAYAATKFKNASIDDIAGWENAAAKKRGPVRLKPVVKKPSEPQNLEVVVSEWKNSPEGADKEQTKLKKVGIVRQKTHRMSEAYTPVTKPVPQPKKLNPGWALDPTTKAELKRRKDVRNRKGVDEGWSDAIVSQRTGQPRTPYSVYIKGKKWKDFENDDHAEAVANKLRAKFKAEGRDPSVITIAPTDYDKGMSEAANAAQQAAIAINMKKHNKKPKQVDEIKKGQKDSNGNTGCWDGYHAQGTKTGKNGGQVRNCVKNEDIDEGVWGDIKVNNAIRKHERKQDAAIKAGNYAGAKKQIDHVSRLEKKFHPVDVEEDTSASAFKVGDAIWVRDQDGKPVTGKVVELRPGTVVFATKDGKRFRAPEGRVMRAQDAELHEEFDLIESAIHVLAERNQVDPEVIWEDLESLSDDELYVFAATQPINEDWQKANKKDRTDGMSKKAVKSYRREHPGSKLQTAVTTKPSKLKKGSKASKRRKSYCSRSKGQMKMHNISCQKTPDKAICKARRRWNCEESIQEGSMATAAHHSTGPKFGGYYKGTQVGAPRPGQSFGAESVEPKGYAARVRELERKGLTRSDAQGVADAEVMQGKLKETEHENPMGDKELAYLIAKAKGMKTQPDPALHKGDDHEINSDKDFVEGAKVDRMVQHIKKSEKAAGKSAKDAEAIAWATANKRGMLDNVNKKKTNEGMNFMEWAVAQGSRFNNFAANPEVYAKARQAFFEDIYGGIPKIAKVPTGAMYSNAKLPTLKTNLRKAKEEKVRAAKKLNSSLTEDQLDEDLMSLFGEAQNIYGIYQFLKANAVPVGLFVSAVLAYGLHNTLKTAKGDESKFMKMAKDAWNKVDHGRVEKIVAWLNSKFVDAAEKMGFEDPNGYVPDLTEVDEAEAELKPGQYYVWTVHFDDGTESKVKVTSDQFDPKAYYAKKNKVVIKTDYDWTIHG